MALIPRLELIDIKNGLSLGITLEHENGLIKRSIS
jgi:hypothetical protein